VFRLRKALEARGGRMIFSLARGRENFGKSDICEPNDAPLGDD
jgi:hypothetical protein